MNNARETFYFAKCKFPLGRWVRKNKFQLVVGRRGVENMGGGFLKKIIFNKIVFFKLYFLEYIILRRKERKAKQNVLVLHKQYR